MRVVNKGWSGVFLNRLARGGMSHARSWSRLLVIGATLGASIAKN